MSEKVRELFNENPELWDCEREIIKIWKTYFTKKHLKFLAQLLLED